MSSNSFRSVIAKTLRFMPETSRQVLVGARFFSAAGCHATKEASHSRAQYSRFDPAQWTPRWKADGLTSFTGNAFKPTTSVTIKYGDKQVLGGNELKPAQTTMTPSVFYVPEKDAYYSLVLTDVDASPSSEWQVWMVGNIRENNVLDGDVIAPYLGVGPCKESGTHRFAFILYKQPKGRIDFSSERKLKASSGEGRGLKWRAAEFASRHELQPVGLNYFKAKWDSSVNDLYAMSQAESHEQQQAEFEELWDRAYQPRCMESMR